MTALNDKIVAYLKLNNIEFSSADFMVVSTNDTEEIAKWNKENIGPLPSLDALDAAFNTYETDEKTDEVRADRNNRLVESDWTQMADSPVDKEAWAIYRQELRDVPSQPGFPWNVVWPNKPE